MPATDAEEVDAKQETQPYGEDAHVVVNGTADVPVQHEERNSLEGRHKYTEGEIVGCVIQNPLVFRMMLARHKLTHQNTIAFGREKYDAVRKMDTSNFAPVDYDSETYFTWSNRKLLVVCEQDPVRQNGEVDVRDGVMVPDGHFYLGDVAVAGSEDSVVDFYTDVRRAAVAVADETRGEREIL